MKLGGQLAQDLRYRFPRLRMGCDGSADADIVCSRFDCLSRGHEPFLIARFCPAWPNSLDSDFDSVAKLEAQRFDFTRTGNHSIDSCFCASSGQPEYLILDGVRDSNFAQRLFGLA